MAPVSSTSTAGVETAVGGDVGDALPGVAHGHYAEKQLHCRSSVIAFSHRARFKKALELAGEDAQGRLLDYGSGDRHVSRDAGQSVRRASGCGHRRRPG